MQPRLERAGLDREGEMGRNRAADHHDLAEQGPSSEPRREPGAAGDPQQTVATSLQQYSQRSTHAESEVNATRQAPRGALS